MLFVIKKSNMLDSIIILLSIFMGILFLLFSISRIFTIYLWLIFWFLIFFILNTQVSYISLLQVDKLSPYQQFILKDYKVLYYLSFIFIFIFPFVFSFFTCKCNKSKYLSIILGFLLPFILLWFFVFINENIFIKLNFLNFLSNYFLDSKFYDFFYFHEDYIFYLLACIIFFKLFYYIILIFYNFVIWFYKKFKQWLLNGKIKK